MNSQRKTPLPEKPWQCPVCKRLRTTHRTYLEGKLMCGGCFHRIKIEKKTMDWKEYIEMKAHKKLLLELKKTKKSKV